MSKERFNTLVTSALYNGDNVSSFEHIELLLGSKLALKLKKLFKYSIGALFDTDSYFLALNGFKDNEIVKILAIKAIATHAAREKLINCKDVISSPEIAYTFLKLKFGSCKKEHFSVIHLNSSNEVIGIDESMFTGTIDQAQVYPREILRQAIINNAASIILVHNHPSGNSKPSDDDIILTKKLESLSKEFGLRIHDHIVVSDSHAFSIRANRLLDN